MSESLLRTLVDSSLRITVLAAAVALILVALRVRAADVRHATWRVVLGAMLLMPILPHCVPTLAIPLAMPPEIGTGALRNEAPISTSIPDVVEKPRRASIDALLPTPPHPVPEAPPSREVPWRLVAFTYGLGVSMLLLRLWIGWRRAKGLVRRSRPVAPEEAQSMLPSPRSARVCESKLVATPVTLGILRLTIMLPMEWRLWPDDERRAVIAHELAHARRRDPLVSFLARFNCCVFWFHPLAWWLERKLAATAEYACDAEVVRHLGNEQRYAEVLLDMAEAVRRTRGRVSWHGLGIDGGGLVAERIDHLLSARRFDVLSPLRRRFVIVGSGAAMLIVAACHPREDAPPALRDLRSVSASEARRQADDELRQTAESMSPEQVADLESAFETKRHDLVALKKLLLFYWAAASDAGFAAQEGILAKRRACILWLIEHHPESDLAGIVEARLLPSAAGPFDDPLGYARAKRLWLTHANRPGASLAVLGNAAAFFEAADKPLAEEMLLRARAQDPAGPWSRRLGEFYAVVLTGSWAPAGTHALRALSSPEWHGPYGELVRRKLAESTDPDVLTAAARGLVLSARGAWMDFDPDVLARSCLERSLHFEPQATRARTQLVILRSRERLHRMYELIPKLATDSQHQAVSALPEAERFEVLPELAEAFLGRAESAARDEHGDLQGYIDLARQRSKRFAEDVLALAPRFRNDPRYGAAIYKASMTLGSLALTEGNRKGAVRYLRQASQAPASEELTYTPDIVAWSLLNGLLEAGERESVIGFLERMAQINVTRRTYLRESAAAIRSGRMPQNDSWTLDDL
jgi:beta-lactamase regulating signal transducer with metallopeptidase domain